MDEVSAKQEGLAVPHFVVHFTAINKVSLKAK